MPTEEEGRYETQYERQRQAVYWYNKASNLRGAAGAIWASMREPEFVAVPERLGLGRSFSFSVACPSVYKMLCGMALELLLKAIIIENGGKPKHNHNLPSFWREAGLEPTKVQDGLLHILRHSISWDGRYPIPKEETDFNQIVELERKFLFTPVGEGTNLLKRNDALNWESFNQLWAQALQARRPDPSLNRGWVG